MSIKSSCCKETGIIYFWEISENPFWKMPGGARIEIVFWTEEKKWDLFHKVGFVSPLGRQRGILQQWFFFLLSCVWSLLYFLFFAVFNIYLSVSSSVCIFLYFVSLFVWLGFSWIINEQHTFFAIFLIISSLCWSFYIEELICLLCF